VANLIVDAQVNGPPAVRRGKIGILGFFLDEKFNDIQAAMNARQMNGRETLFLLKNLTELNSTKKKIKF
jgi:hypothetical protein